MKLESDGKPFYYKNGKFHGICRYDFMGNMNGAKLFCKKLGYDDAASIEMTDDTYGVDGIRIGECLSEDTDLSACTGKHNWYNTEACGPMEQVAISIKCQKHSCQGQIIL